MRMVKLQEGTVEMSQLTEHVYPRHARPPRISPHGSSMKSDSVCASFAADPGCAGGAGVGVPRGLRSESRPKGVCVCV